MQVIRTENASSFYESFSDLIFCTLVLFILLFLVLALSVERQASTPPDERPAGQPPQNPAIAAVNIVALQDELRITKRELEKTQIRLSVMQQDDTTDERLNLQQQENELAVQRQQLSQLLGSNRFVGRSGQSFLCVAVNVAPAGNWKYVPYPSQLQTDYNVGRNGESQAEAEARQTRARTDFHALARRSRHYSADELQQILTAGLQRYLDDDGEAASVMVQMAGAFSAVFSGARNIKGHMVDEPTQRKLLTVDLFREFGTHTDEDIPEGTLPVLQFRLTGAPRQRLSCGGVRLTSADAVRLIQAFAGRGVAVEVQPDAPDWFLEDVLKPTGYINRAPAATIENVPPPAP